MPMASGDEWVNMCTLMRSENKHARDDSHDDAGEEKDEWIWVWNGVEHVIIRHYRMAQSHLSAN